MPELPPLPEIAAAPISVVLLSSERDSQLAETIAVWTAVLDGLQRDYEILLADDAPTDRTAALTEQLGPSQTRLRVLYDPARRGQGAALRLALSAAQHALICCADCQSGYQPSDLESFLKEMNKVHLLTGKRVGPPVPFYLRVMGFFYRVVIRILLGAPLEPLEGWFGWSGWFHRWLMRVLFGLRMKDVACSYRVFRREILGRLLLQSDGSFVHEEILAKANFLGCVMSEVKVTHAPLHLPCPAENVLTSASVRQELWRVFAHPDFGPTKLPSATPEGVG